jgi:hypothetical protein
MGSPLWYAWWVGNQGKGFEDIRQRVAREETGGYNSGFTELDAQNMVINMFQSIASMTPVGRRGEINLSAVNMAKVEASLRDYVRKGTELGKEYNQGYQSFVNAVKTQLDDKYDKNYWTDAKLKETFDSQFKAEFGDATNAKLNTLTEISNHFANQVKKGKLDEEGTVIETPKIDTSRAEISKIASNLGFTLSDSGIDYYADLLTTNKAKAYEIEQMLKTTPEYNKAAFEKAYNELFPTLDALSKKQVQESFAELAPEIQRYAGSLGGVSRAFTTEALAKQASELESSRQDYLTTLKANQQLADIQNLANLGITQGQGVYANVLNNAINSQDNLKQLQANNIAVIMQKHQDRYQREVAKEQARLFKQQKEALAAAQKKAGKYGLFSNILGGATSGAASGSTFGPWGALIGGVVGAGAGAYQGTVQNKNQDVMSMYNNYQTNPSSLYYPQYSSPSVDYQTLGSGAASLYGSLANRWSYTNQAGYKQNTNPFYNRYGG